MDTPRNPEQRTDESQRLRAIEEAAGFAEHRTGQLDRAVQELSEQVYELAVKLERVEKRLADLQSASEEQDVPNDPPPHSHRPL